MGIAARLASVIKKFRPAIHGSSLAGAVFAYAVVLAGLPLLVVALIPGLVWSAGSEGARIALVLVCWAMLVAAAGIPLLTRGVLVRIARRLLRMPLPDPPPRALRGESAAAGRRIDRWRTPCWLVLQLGAGSVGLAVAMVLAIGGLALVADLLEPDSRMVLFAWTVQPVPGWLRWTTGIAFLLLAFATCVTVGSAVRWWTPRLLGPTAAERDMLETARELAAAERNRLARELHDSIGHTLTATTIQAAVAGELLAADPATARTTLRSIEETSRAALADLDYVLGALRQDALREDSLRHDPMRPNPPADDGHDPRALAPTPTLADLPELLERLRYAGAQVDSQFSGEWDGVHGSVSRAAYRVVQEGVTNALRHGDGGLISVQVTARTDDLELRVANGRAAARDGGTRPGQGGGWGRGLAGVAERVKLLGGEVSWGPADAADRGETGRSETTGATGTDSRDQWRLWVRLPLR